MAYNVQRKHAVVFAAIKRLISRGKNNGATTTDFFTKFQIGHTQRGSVVLTLVSRRARALVGTVTPATNGALTNL